MTMFLLYDNVKSNTCPQKGGHVSKTIRYFINHKQEESKKNIVSVRLMSRDIPYESPQKTEQIEHEQFSNQLIR